MANKRVGIVGCGYWGANYLKTLRDKPEVKVSSVCDLVSPKRTLIPKGAKFTKNYNTTLNSCDAVIIATPTDSHYDHAKKALEMGKDVLLEKPMTRTSEQAKELIELAEKNSCVLMTGHIFCYNPAFKRLEEEISGGSFGNIVYMTSSRESLGPIRNKDSVLWDLLPHDISMFLKLNGMPSRLQASGSSYLRKSVEDVVSLNMHYSNGVMTTSRASWMHPLKIRQVVVVGDKRMAIFDDAAIDKLTFYDKGVEKIDDVDLNDYSVSCRVGDIYSPKVDAKSPLELGIDHFIQCIEKRTNPLTDGKHGLDVVKILEAANKSLKEKKEIRLK